MGIFDRKKKETKKKAEDKKVPVKVEKKEESMKDLYVDKKKSTSKKDTTEKKETKTLKSGQAYKVLLKPLVTEKASVLASEDKYFFEVAINANKVEIAKAINEVYGVRPVSINVIRMQGKRTRYGRTMGKKKNWKKAIVTLPKGETIKVYEGT